MDAKLQKLVLRMSKVAIYALLFLHSVFTVALPSTSEAQRKKLNEIYLEISSGQKSVLNFLAEVEQNSDFTFAYSKQEVRKKSIHLAKPLWAMDELLKEVSMQAQLSFRRVNEIITIRKVEQESRTPVVSDQIEAQFAVSGIIRDENNDPLPGATLLEKGTANGTVTDVEGRYTINVSDEKAILIISFLGYAQEEIAVNGRSVIDVSMTPDISALQEVIVVGYGVQRKGDLTGSVASISAEEVQAVPTLSLDQSLQGRVAGVQVTQATAQPGGAVSVRIRGGNSITAGNEPLYVIDGFIGAGDLNSINPNDIASIEILKDASATAIYGARGANGVVLITTQTGKSGKMQVNVDIYRGVQEVRETIDLMNAAEYAELVNEVSVQNGQSPVFDNPAALGEGTDWQDELFRTAPMENYQLSFSGGQETIQYLFSVNYFNQQGIVENTGFDRFSIRSNINAALSEKVKLGTNLTISRTNRTRINNEGNEVDGSGIITDALIFSPTEAADAEVNLDFGSEVGNPVLYVERTTDDLVVNRVLGNLFLEYEVIEGLSLKTSFGADVITEKSNFYLPQSVFDGDAVNGEASVAVNQSINWLNENTISYRKEFGSDHSLNMVAGITLQQYDFESVSATARDFANDVLEYNNLGAGGNLSIAPTSGANEWSLLSYLFRTNYILKGKYLFTVTGRYDGSSRFGSGNKYAFFPSAALGWRVIDEPFMDNINFLSELKLRTSYGLTGSQEIGTFISLAALGSDQLVFGDAVAIGFFPGRFANPNLKWETTGQLDIGVDVGLLQGRINATLDYYYKKTEDLLLDVPVPNTTGQSSTLQNIGELENEGFEFSVSTVNTTGDFEWETSINLATNRQEILSLGPDEEILLNDLGGVYKVGSPGILKVGEPLGSFFGFKTDGILQDEADVIASGMDPTTTQPGDRKLVDTDGDGDVDSDDRVILGQSAPTLFGGITNNFSYKGFDMSLFFQWVSGNSILNLQRTLLENPTGEANQLKKVTNRWTPENRNNEIPRAGSSNIDQVLDVFVEDGDFLRLRNITIGYDLTHSLLKSQVFSKARIYLSANNLLTFTDYSGFDPEVNVFGQNNLRSGIDFGSYPMARTFLAGINLSF